MRSSCHSSSGIPVCDDAALHDQELVAASRAGSSDAFQEIQKRYSHRLYRRILSITRNREDAEDALQDTFLRAFVAIDSFEGRSQFSSWLTRIAINTALMAIRKRRTRSEVSFQPTSEPDEANVSFDIRDTAMNPEELFDLKQRSNSVLNAIKRLDPNSRTAIGIWVTQESSMKEIAQTLDVSLATVKSRLHRARKRLAQFSGSGDRGRGFPSPHRRTFDFGPRNREQPCLNHECV